MSEKSFINLLQPELFPEKPFLTLPRVLQIWTVLAIVLILSIVISGYFLASSSDKLAKLRNTNSQQNNQLATLQSQLSQHKPDQLLLSKLETLKRVLANKQEMQQQLTNVNSTYVAGFGQAMTDLSSMHSREISLQHVRIDLDDMTLSGMAKAPESVPTWLALFESSTVLKGKVFSHFSLAENESDYTDFRVSTVKGSVIKSQGK